jgi:hypothetical protein
MNLVNAYYKNTQERSIESHQWPLAAGGSILPTHTYAVDGHPHAFLISVSDTGELSVGFIFWQLHSWGKSPQYPLERRLRGP